MADRKENLNRTLDQFPTVANEREVLLAPPERYLLLTRCRNGRIWAQFSPDLNLASDLFTDQLLEAGRRPLALADLDQGSFTSKISITISASNLNDSSKVSAYDTV